MRPLLRWRLSVEHAVLCAGTVVGMTWKLVKETFENAGEVAFCEITESKTKTGTASHVVPVFIVVSSAESPLFVRRGSQRLHWS